MEIKNRKMNVLMIIWTFVSSLLILVLFRALKNTNTVLLKMYKKVKQLNIEDLELSEKITNILEDNLETKKLINKNLEDHYELIYHLRKMYMLFDIFKISSPLAIRLTLHDIVTSKEIPSIQKMNVVLLKNLIEEYNNNIKELEQRIEKSDDQTEQEKIRNIVEEFRNMITLISTVSEESSQEYVEQIYHEIFSSVKKIKGI